MSIFEAIEAQDGMTVPQGLRGQHQGISIVIRPQQLKMHGDSYVLDGPITTETQLGESIQKLISELQLVRETAKAMLARNR